MKKSMVMVVVIGLDPATTPNFVAQDYIMTMEELVQREHGDVETSRRHDR